MLVAHNLYDKDYVDFQDLDPNGYDENFEFYSVPMPTQNPVDLSKSIKQRRKKEIISSIQNVAVSLPGVFINKFFETYNNPSGWLYMSKLIDNEISKSKSLKFTKQENDINFRCPHPNIMESFEINPPIQIGLVKFKYLVKVNEINKSCAETINKKNGRECNELIGELWRKYPSTRQYWTLTCYKYSILWHDIVLEDGRRINQFMKPVIDAQTLLARRRIRRNIRIVRPVEFEYIEDEENIEYEENIEEYILRQDLTQQHGQIDIYPNKVRTAPNTYDVITKFGNTTSTTNVTVNKEGNIEKVNSQKISRNRSESLDGLDFEAESNERGQVKVKINREYPSDYYFGYKALVALNEYGHPSHLCIAKLKISIKAKVAISAFETKARCDEASVVCIYAFEVDDGVVTYTESLQCAQNFVFGNKVINYEVGKTYNEPNFKNDPLITNRDFTYMDPSICEAGIHFCFSQEDALRFHHIKSFIMITEPIGDNEGVYLPAIINPEVFRTEPWEKSMESDMYRSEVMQNSPIPQRKDNIFENYENTMNLTIENNNNF